MWRHDCVGSIVLESVLGLLLLLILSLLLCFIIFIFVQAEGRSRAGFCDHARGEAEAAAGG